jgi:hypothetical protein
MWALSSFRRIKPRKRKNTGFIMCFEQEERKKFTLFERLKNDMQKLFKYFRKSILKS